MDLSSIQEVEAAVAFLETEVPVTSTFLQQEKKSLDTLADNLAYVIMSTVNTWGKDKTIDLVPVASVLSEVIAPVVQKLKFQVRPLIQHIRRIQDPALKKTSEEKVGNYIIDYVISQSRMMLIQLADHLKDLNCPAEESSDSSSDSDEEEEIKLLLDSAETKENVKHSHEICFYLWDLYCYGLGSVNPFLATLPERG